jgi:RNA polymerase sigma-70 factor, ECF subfamily
VVRLNRAVAVAERDGNPAAALGLLDGLEDPLGRMHLFWSTRAELLHRAGRDTEAAADYGRALELANTDAERRLLTTRRAALR